MKRILAGFSSGLHKTRKDTDEAKHRQTKETGRHMPNESSRAVPRPVPP